MHVRSGARDAVETRFHLLNKGDMFEYEGNFYIKFSTYRFESEALEDAGLDLSDGSIEFFDTSGYASSRAYHVTHYPGATIDLNCR